MPFRAFHTTLALIVVACSPVRAQTTLQAPPDSPAATVPFGPGERLGYRVTLGFLGTVGHGVLEVQSVDTVRGRQAYRIGFDLEGGVPLAHVDDSYESWLDVVSLNSLRYHKDQKEVRYVNKSAFDFYPDQKRYYESIDKEWHDMPTDSPLDEIGFLFYVRTLPLKVGETYTFNRYYKDSGNPVTLKVLRRETVTVPAGTFKTIVVQPVIKTSGLFGEGGEAQVYLSDDDRRMVVQLTSKVKVLKSLNLYLETFVPGEPLSALPASSAKTGT